MVNLSLGSIFKNSVFPRALTVYFYNFSTGLVLKILFYWKGVIVVTNREAAKKVFDYIRKNNFMPVNIQYGNYYFIFDKGKDSVIHFGIKGLRNWKFAMWVNTNLNELKYDKGEYPAIQFFCQHKTNIDKFKPSRSFFLAKYTLADVERKSDLVFYEVIDILLHIKRHPFIAFCMDACEDYLYSGSYIMGYIKSHLLQQHAYPFKQRWHL